ncbi:hypothetical protein D5S18_08025 [Nocardia panacis]|uniref:Transcriptional regulator n=1 Tax=Nocardia panacis TaxID=2340916 RepID=A0A3A4KSD6_9NOCA|nr:hypothetical protein [Nocardia panacis]RJO77670.1 hypothetical protein D5S18_08025 [Nocardia panacis]
MHDAPLENPAPEAQTMMLRTVLGEAGWGPRDLTRAVNMWLAQRGRPGDRIDATAAYSWVRSGYCPHGDIAEVVATVLGDRLGRYITASQLWPGHTRAERITCGTRLPSEGSIDEAIRSLDQLAAGIRPAPISGSDLAAAAITGLRDPIELRGGSQGRDRIHHSQAGLIADHVTALRQLDDCQGGGALSLRYVSRELATVIDLLRSGSHEPAVQDSLLTSIADLAQLAGWMSFDSGATETAQRYLVLGIRIARAARDGDRAINAAGMLAYIAAEVDAGHDSVAITEAAATLPTSSLLLKARLAGRQASAHAAAGDIAAFRAASDRAQHLLDTARRDHTEPYLYYLTPDQLAAEAGYSLVQLARRTEVHRRPLLRQASDLLTPRANLDRDPGYQRSAVLHGCQLAQVHLMLGDLDGVVAAARRATTMLGDVQSGRCVTKLRGLHRDLLQRRRSRVVCEFLPELEHILGAL